MCFVRASGSCCYLVIYWENISCCHGANYSVSTKGRDSISYLLFCKNKKIKIPLSKWKKIRGYFYLSEFFSQEVSVGLGIV